MLGFVFFPEMREGFFGLVFVGSTGGGVSATCGSGCCGSSSIGGMESGSVAAMVGADGVGGSPAFFLVQPCTIRSTTRRIEVTNLCAKVMYMRARFFGKYRMASEPTLPLHHRILLPAGREAGWCGDRVSFA